MTGLTEADTCRKYVLPKLIASGWDDELHSFTEQRTFTDGRIIVSGGQPRRGKKRERIICSDIRGIFPLQLWRQKQTI